MNLDCTIDAPLPVETNRTIVLISSRSDCADAFENGGIFRCADALLAVRAIPGNAKAVCGALIAARDAGYQQAIVLGSLPPRSPNEVSALLAAARQHPQSLVIGVPIRLSPPGTASKLSRLLIRLETGVRLRGGTGESRVYPLRLMELIPGWRKGKAGETELLVRAGWVGCPIVEIDLPIAADEARKPSKREMIRQAATHVFLLARALGGWPHPKYAPIGPQPKLGTRWQRFWRWINPLYAWRELRRGEGNPQELAVGIAVGVFIANLPLPGCQTLLAIYTARRLHLHPMAVVTGSHASAPPFAPFLIAAALWIGHLILHGSRLARSGIDLRHGKFLTNGLPLLMDWMVGAALIGAGMAMVAYWIAHRLFRMVEKRSVQQAT